jgi:colicin import membrane protein
MMLSLLLHAAILAFLVLSPSFPSPKLTFGPVYDVSLVDFTGKSPAGGSVSASEKGIHSERAYKPIIKKNVVEKNVVPIYRMEKESDGKRTFEKAIDKIKKKVSAGMETQKPSATTPSADTYSGADHAAGSAGGRKTAVKNGSGSGSSVYSSSGKGGGSDARINIYYRDIWFRIKENWVLPQAIIPKGGLESVVAITVLRGGAITDFRFEKTSGNKYFDESAMKAIQKASPLPPFPGWLSGSSLNLGIRFRSSEWGH